MLENLKFNSLLHVESEAALINDLVAYTENIGFRTVSCVVIQDLPDRSAHFYSLDNMPDAYQEAFNNEDVGPQDPVMQHLKRSSLPIIWNQSTYVAKRAGSLHETMDGHGIGTGIIAAAHMPNGLHFCLGLDREAANPISTVELESIASSFQLLFVHAQDAAARLMHPENGVLVNPDLTAREYEVLAWRMEGKTAWETGAILGISESTVVKYLCAATQKLGCVNKDHAVVTALRRGILS